MTNLSRRAILAGSAASAATLPGCYMHITTSPTLADPAIDAVQSLIDADAFDTAMYDALEDAEIARWHSSPLGRGRPLIEVRVKRKYVQPDYSYETDNVYQAGSEHEIEEHCERGFNLTNEDRDRLIAEFRAQEADYLDRRKAAGVAEFDQRSEDARQAREDAFDALCATPASSLQGIAGKARMLIDHHYFELDCRETEMVASILADLDAMIGGVS